MSESVSELLFCSIGLYASSLANFHMQERTCKEGGTSKAFIFFFFCNCCARVRKKSIQLLEAAAAGSWSLGSMLIVCEPSVALAVGSPPGAGALPLDL